MKTNTKTNAKTKLLLLLLTFAMTITLFAGCGKKTPEAGETSNREIEDEFTGDVTTSEIVPEFEPVNFDTEICILQNDSSGGSIRREEWNPEDAENENLEYALVDKLEYLENKYGVTFELRKRTKNDAGGALANEIMSNTGTYDIIDFPLSQTAILATRGLLYDLSAVENVDLSKPWWNQMLNDEIDYNGKTFFAVGNSNLSSMWTACCVFFNKSIAESLGYSYTSVYDMVFNHTWTMEKMLEISANAYSDKDGDTLPSDGDIYGISQTGGGWYTAFYGTGLKFVSTDEEGNFVLNPFDQALIDRIETIVNYKNNSEIAYTGAGDQWNQFTEGRALFLVEFVCVATRAKASSTDYGILPSPLGEAGQASYYTSIHTGHSSAFSIPTDIWDGDLPMLGIILEEANYISRKIVWPEMYDTLLKGQIARDPQSAEILDIIFGNLIVDPMMMYASKLNDIVRALIDSGDTTNIKSSLEKGASAANAALREINSAYKALG